MTEILVLVVAGLLVIATATVLGPRMGVASPLVLVAVGIAASFVPALTTLDISPELILQGVLPPLLYAAAVSMPSMNFRRDFAAISGLSVVLVIGSSLLLGLFFQLVIPDLGFAWGVALGAIVSPTDAVATTIIKQASASPRVVAMLDGESLLNDATALVVLRTAIAAIGAGFSFWSAAGTFAYSVAIAVALGVAVGWANLRIRRRVSDPTVNTVISFAVPFLASIPAEALEASGLVAAVVAGLITGYRAPRDLSPQNRLSDSQNWRTVELVLQGAVFLIMGLQMRVIVIDLERDHGGLLTSLGVAVAGLGLVIAIRAVYVTPLLAALQWRIGRGEEFRDRLADLQERLTTPEGKQQMTDRMVAAGRKATDDRMDRFAVRVTRGLASMDYFRRHPLGWREGVVVIWAGMRGAVTVAAAQTLPEDTPQRPVLIFVAFAVATISLLVQGGTVAWVLRLVRPPNESAVEHRERDEQAAERRRLLELLHDTGSSIPEPDEAREPTPAAFAAAKRFRLAVLAAQRSALLEARDHGTFDAEVLADELANLDAAQIAIELRGRGVD